MIVISQARNSALDEGVWASFGGSKFLIAHTSNLQFQRTMARLQAPHRKAIEKGNMDPEDSKEIVCKALSQCILKDWADVKDLAGNSLKYDKDIGYIALKNNEELREFVQEFSTDLANFRDTEIEDKGNA